MANRMPLHLHRLLLSRPSVAVSTLREDIVLGLPLEKPQTTADDNTLATNQILKIELWTKHWITGAWYRWRGLSEVTADNNPGMERGDRRCVECTAKEERGKEEQ